MDEETRDHMDKDAIPFFSTSGHTQDDLVHPDFIQILPCPLSNLTSPVRLSVVLNIL
jgi:hypothetical protein